MGKGQNWPAVAAAVAAVQKEVWKYRDRTFTFLLSVENLHKCSLSVLASKNIKSPYISQIKNSLGWSR